MKTLPNLYFLRFFLSILVVLYHIPITSKNVGLPYFDDVDFLNKGTLAVYYFFSLSGFLIFRVLYLELKENRKVDLKRFYLKRISRLWPVYFLVIIIGLFLYHILTPFLGVNYETTYNINKLLLYYLLFIPNIFNGIHKVGGILNITWSIGVEEQFYLFFPFLFVIFKKNIMIVLVSLLLIFLFLLMYFESFYVYKNYYFYFILGGIFAILAEKGKFYFLKNKMISLFFLLLFVLSFFTNMFVFENNKLEHVFNLVVSCFLILTMAFYPVVILDKLKMNYLGKISYGIYMYHMIIVTLILYGLKFLNLDKLIDQTVLILGINFLIVSVTILTAHFSYQYFEKKFYLKSRKAQLKEETSIVILNEK
ncbi:MAG: acyltransferase [Flavobacteriaceae bacterium]|nr:acyltransferase [Flavobacteriaceae bacterium]